jgi:O-antigen/teichoic acid export membrane protein
VRAAFGPDFASAASVLRWLLPGVVATSITTVLSQYLASIGMPKLLVGVWLMGVGLVLVLGAALIPDHGAVGAAAATSVAYVAVLLLVFALCRRHRGQTATMEWVEPVVGSWEV